MQLEINTRHFSLGKDQREGIVAGFEKLEKFSPRPVISVQMTIDHDAGRFTAESVLRLKAHDFRASATGAEPNVVAGEVIENLRRQLTKFKGKASGKQKGEEGGLGAALPSEELTDTSHGENSGALVLKDMDVDTARASFEVSGLPFLVFRNAASQRVAVVYRQDDGTTAHLESSES